MQPRKARHPGGDDDSEKVISKIALGKGRCVSKGWMKDFCVEVFVVKQKRQKKPSVDVELACLTAADKLRLQTHRGEDMA